MAADRGERLDAAAEPGRRSSAADARRHARLGRVLDAWSAEFGEPSEEQQRQAAALFDSAEALRRGRGAPHE